MACRRCELIDGLRMQMAEIIGDQTTNSCDSSHQENPLSSSHAHKAYQKLLHLIAYREYSTASIERKLRSYDFEPSAIKEAITRAETEALIDNRRYSDALIRSRLSDGKGLEPALKEISSLGIDPTTLDSYQDYLSSAEVDEVLRAQHFLDRHPTSAKNLQRGAFQKLIHAGFPSTTATQAARLWASRQLSPSQDSVEETS